MIMPTQTYSITEMRHILRISKNLAYEVVRDGRVPAIRLGKTWRVPAQWLDNLVATGTGLPTLPADNV